MAFKLLARTRENTSTVGTGALTLTGTPALNNRTFASQLSEGDQTYCATISADGAAWEEGLYTLTSGQLARTTIIANSAGTTSPVTLAGGVVFGIIPGDFQGLFAKLFAPTNDADLMTWDAATSKFVARASAARGWHPPAQLATTAALPANTYNNGSSGVGATLTANSNGALSTIDGISLVVGYRVVVWHEATTSHNGIYVVTQIGDGSHPYILTRAADFNGPSNIDAGHMVSVGAAGTANGRTILGFYSSVSSIVVGTSDINFDILGIRNSQGLDLISGTEDDLIVRRSTAWAGLAKGTTGQGVGVDDTGHVNYLHPRYIIAGSIDGVPTASQRVLYHRVSKAVTIPANFGAVLGHASQAGGSVAATASTVFAVAKAASASPNTFTSAGTITFAAAGVVPTFASASGAAISLSQGDVLRIMAPASPDATFAGFYATIVGYET